MKARKNVVLADSANDWRPIDATASEIRALFEAAREAEKKSDRLMLDGLLCMVAAVSLLVTIAVCTLTDSDQVNKGTAPSPRHLLADSPIEAEHALEINARLTIEKVSSMFDSQDIFSQQAIFNKLRELRDRVPNAVEAALAGR